MNSYEIPKTCPEHPGEKEDYILFPFSYHYDEGKSNFNNPSDTKAMVQYPCACIYECAKGEFNRIVNGEDKEREK